MRLVDLNICVAAKKNGIINHIRAAKYLNDTIGISDVIEVISIQPNIAIALITTGCFSMAVS